jgi:hypothetical protein
MIAFDAPPPAIVQAAEPWETLLDAELARRGTPASIRIAVVRELRRLQGIRQEYRRPTILAPALADLARFAGDAALAAAFMPGLRVFPGTISAAASAVFTANAASATTSLAYSFSSLNFSTASADRHILIGTAGQAGSATTVSTVTIGGVSASEVFSVASSTVRVAFWIAAVPTGTSGTVAITWAAQRARCAVIVWALTGLLSTTAVDTGSEVNSGTSALNDNVDINAGGVCLAMAYDGGTGSRNWTWSGLTEVVDTTFASGRSYTGASADFASAQSGFAVQTTPSGSTTANVIGIVSLR